MCNPRLGVSMDGTEEKPVEEPLSQANVLPLVGRISPVSLHCPRSIITVSELLLVYNFLFDGASTFAK